MLKKYLFIFFFLFSFISIHSQEISESTNIFIQSTQGSFCHQAFNILIDESKINNPKIFCGTPFNAMKSAVENNGYAFFALKNTTIAKNYVQETLNALKEYEIINVFSVIQMKIEMSLLRHEEALLNQVSLKQIASHPAALQQIILWKEKFNFNEIEITRGTAEAARMLSTKELTLDTAVVGPKSLILLYPNIVVIEEAINDKEDNYTTFVLVNLKQRSNIACEEKIKEELVSLGFENMSDFK